MRSTAHEMGSVSHLILDEVVRASGATRADLARYLGVPESQLSRWASGDRPMPVEVIPHLARWCRSPQAALGELAARSGMLLVPMEGAEVPLRQTVKDLKRAGLRLAHLIEEALEDGEISDAERADINQVVNDLEKQIGAWKTSRGGR